MEKRPYSPKRSDVNVNWRIGSRAVGVRVIAKTCCVDDAIEVAVAFLNGKGEVPLGIISSNVLVGKISDVSVGKVVACIQLTNNPLRII
ncbi:MAG: hypothetical protein Fur0022_35670 [Anaerolineales bacterium]